MNSNQNFNGPTPETRRTFIKKAATVAAVAATSNLFKTPVYGQNQAPSPGRVIGANDRIVVAYVGVGGQGMAHVRSQKTYAGANNIVQAAVCDLYQKHLQQAQQAIGLTDADAFGDHRKLLERKDIDAITVATVDNWHAQVAIDALEAGKHVYGEKPLSRYLGEALDLHDTVKRTGKVFQVGSQYCADPQIHQAAKWIKEGKLGPLVWAQGSYCRNNKNNSEWTYPVDKDANEGNLDWKRWLGKSKQIPFDPNRYFSWHKYYDYNAGILGNLLPHQLLPLMLATGNTEYPCRVVCTGTKKISTDREISDTTHLLAEFPSGLTLCIAGSTVNEKGFEQIIRGRKAIIEFSASKNSARLTPERLFSEEIEAAEFNDGATVADIGRLEKNFFDCIRNGQTPYANIDLAVRAQTVISLAEMSERMDLCLRFDEKTRKIHTGGGREIQPLSYDTVL